MAKLTATPKATKVNGPTYKGKKNGKDGRDLKGLEKSAAGPFRGRDRPFQCFKCHGWGHSARDCPSLENYQWGRVTLTNLLCQKKANGTAGKSNGNESKSTPSSESDTKSRPRQDSIETRATAQKTKDQYYNPDPLARLIGKSNESMIIIDGKQCTALIDSGAQVMTITIDMVNKLKLPVYGLKTLLNFRGMGGRTYSLSWIYWCNNGDS